MADIRKLVASFSGGEVSPLMVSRFDDGRTAQGLRLCRNAITYPQGSAARRPGLATVREVKDSSKRTRLIPFSYGAGQELAVEVGAGYFRFHAQGSTLLYIEGIPAASVDTSTERITFSRPHGLAADEQIRFLAGTGGTLPTGTTATGYYTRLVDARTIEISLTAGGAAVNITSTGTAPFYCYRLADQPATYISSRAFSTSSTVSDDITTSGAHNLTNGDPITFTLSGGTLPTYLEDGVTYSLLPGVVYYANVTAASIFRVSKTRADALANVYLNFNAVAVVAGGPIVHYHYTVGQYVTHSTPDGYFRCIQDGPQLNVPGTTTYWQQMPADGVLEVPLPYQEADLPDVNFAQSGDTMTLVHPQYPPAELSRLSAVAWSYKAIDFDPPLLAPTNASVSPVAGLTHSIVTVDSGPSPAELVTDNEHGLAINDPVYASGSIGDIPAGFYAVRSVPAVDRVTLKTLDGGADVDSTGTTPGGKLRYASASSEITNFYRVTAIDASGGESDGSNAAGATNNLLTEGSYNTVTWAAVPGAARYRVYKAQTGLYGYIGETEELTFKDDNIAPDLGRTLPRFDTSLSGGDYPGAVGYFEGRRVFGGTLANPRSTWWSRVGYPSDLTFHIPVQDDDRIRRDVDARQAVTIRHIVPMSQLLLLTDTAEFRVSPLNTDSITPASISVRPQTYVGGSMVQPVVINGTVVFAAARGGHLREMGYRQDEGYLAGDLSLRATHLFDGLTIKDMAYQKAPRPIVWCVSSDGRLLGLTYTPEEGVGGWHQHTTDGTVESVCCVNDGGEEDSLYLVVKRTLDGTSYRFVERMAEQVQPDDAADWRFLDACVTFDGTNTTATTLSIARSATWAAGQTVTITATGGQVFRLSTPDEGDYIRAAYDGSYYRFRITSVSTGLVASAVIVDAVPLATATTSFAAGTDWGWMRGTITTPAYLDDVELACIADGVVQSNETPAAGLVTLAAPALKVHLGLSYTTELQLLPIAVQLQALAQGRTTSVKEAWVRYWKSGEFEVGCAEAGVAVGDYDWSRMATDATQEDGLVRELTFPGWNEDSVLRIRQTDPLPLTVVSVTLNVSIGS